MGQMIPLCGIKYTVVVDADVDVHNTSEVLFRLCANTDPQRDSIFTKGPADVLDHATSGIAIGSKLGIDATKKLPGEGFKRHWPPLIRGSSPHLVYPVLPLFQGLEILWTVDPGRRSLSRFAPGYYLSSFQHFPVSHPPQPRCGCSRFATLIQDRRSLAKQRRDW
jgi:hypothetical protein